MSDFLFGILDIVVLEFYVCGFHFFSEKCFVFFSQMRRLWLMSGRDERSCFESKEFVFLRKLLGSVLETVPTTALFENGEEGSNLYRFVMPQLDQWFDDLDGEFSDVSGWGTGEFEKLLEDFEVEGEFEFVHVFFEGFFILVGFFVTGVCLCFWNLVYSLFVVFLKFCCFL